MKKILIMFFCLITVTLSQTKKYTLEESIKLGLKNSKLIKLSTSKWLESKNATDEISAKFLPHLTINASYKRLSDVDPFSVEVPFATSPIKIQDAILDNYSFQASVTQPIFTGFRLLSAKNASIFNQKAFEVENEDEANKVSLEIKKIYLNFVKIKRTKKIIHERLNSITLHIKDSEQYLKNGLITKNEMLKLQVLESETQIKLVEIENNLKLIRSRLNQSLGLALNSDIDVIEEINLDTKPLLDFETIKNEAIKNRADLSSLEFRKKAASENITAAKADYFPQVNFFASFNYDNPNQRIMPLEDKFNDTWAAGISLKWNLWNWGETSAKKQQAAEKFNQINLQADLLKEKIELDVYNKYLKVITENKKVELAQLQLDQTNENYRIVKKKYSEHLISGSDLSDAETDLLEAKLKKLNSVIDRKIAEEELLKSLGRKLY